MGVLLAGSGCPQNQVELGTEEILRIAEKRLDSETIGYRCSTYVNKSHPSDTERGKRIHDTWKKGDHVLYCRPQARAAAGGHGRMDVLDGEKIVFVSKYGVFQY